MTFLQLEDVSKSYGQKDSRVPVLRDINLTIEEGEFIAIVGYSGSGKTTLISLIAGLISPDQGVVSIHGRPVEAPGPDRGVVFQNYSLLPWLSVYENVFLSVDARFPEMGAAQKREHTIRHIEMVNLSAALDKRPRELSGGMRQRVSVARALAGDPEVLLLDEPLSALDALTRATLQDEIARIWQDNRKTVVLITNDVDEGILLADRIIPLSTGPGATLGPGIEVDLPRPRDRKALNHMQRYKEIRRSVLDYLVSQGRQKRLRANSQPAQPDIEEENLPLNSGYQAVDRFVAVKSGALEVE